MEFSEIIFYFLLAAAVILAIRIFTLPIKFLAKLLWNTFTGFFLLLIFNALGSMIGLTVAVNAATALTVGILGVPGLILLLLVKWLYFFV